MKPDQIKHGGNRAGKTLAQQQALVDDWNAKNHIGTPVVVKIDFVDEPRHTKTTTEAFLGGGHTASVFLEGVSGWYNLSHVTANPHSLPVARSNDDLAHGRGVKPPEPAPKRKTIDDVKPIVTSAFDLQLQETIALAKALEQSIRLLAQLAKDDATIDNTHATRIATVILHGAQDVASDLSDFLKR